MKNIMLVRTTYGDNAHVAAINEARPAGHRVYRKEQLGECDLKEFGMGKVRVKRRKLETLMQVVNFHLKTVRSRHGH